MGGNEDGWKQNDTYDVDAIHLVALQCKIIVSQGDWNDLKRKHGPNVSGFAEALGHAVAGSVAAGAEAPSVAAVPPPVAPVARQMAAAASGAVAAPSAAAVPPPVAPAALALVVHRQDVVTRLKVQIQLKNKVIKDLRQQKVRLETVVSKMRDKRKLKDLADGQRLNPYHRGKAKRYFTPRGGLLLGARSLLGNVAAWSAGLALGLDVSGTTLNKYKDLISFSFPLSSSSSSSTPGKQSSFWIVFWLRLSCIWRSTLPLYKRFLIKTRADQ